MSGVDPEDGEGLAYDVGPLLEAVGLDHRPDALAEDLHLGLQPEGHPAFAQELQGRRGGLAVLPEADIILYY